MTNGGLSEMSLGYSYDAAGNLINVNESGKNFSYFYDAAGRLKKETNSVTGITTEYAYYASGNIKDLRNFGGGNLLDNYEYSYDSRGNRTEEIENGRSTQYYYDALSRISSCLTEGGGSLNYSYDDLGNICQVVATGRSLSGSTHIIETNYSYDQNNRLLLQETVNGNSLEQVRFRYDNEGNQTEKAEVSKQNGNLIASNTLTFCYNGFNQLTNVTDSDNNLTVYTYNAQGLRTSKHNANDGTSTKYYYDGSTNIILETTAENAVTAKNIRGLHLISRENAGAEPFYYLFNAHGDVTKLTDELGNVIKDYSYDPFGNEKASELNPLGGNLSISLWQTEAAAIDNPFRYCGECLDLETNNYYLRARYYDPAIERFLSEDTYTGQVTEPLSLNFYIYCKNNPIIFVDASGYDPVPIWVKNINAGKGTEADYNEAFKVYEKGSASTWAGTARFAVDKAIDKTLDIMYADRLPKTGEPNSVRKIYNPDGTVKQERIYGPDGQPVRDRDYNHGGEGHEFPHDHDWVNGERQPGVPVPKPDPTQGTNISSSEAEEAAGWALAGTVLYWVISEGSRIVLPRNLIPIP